MHKKILVVDDIRETVLMISDILSPHGFTIFQAYDGIEALELLQKETVDLLLTDIRMPRMDGFELAKKVRELYPRIGIIVMTAFVSIYQDSDIRELGIDEYIAKPFSLEILLEKLERVYLQVSLLKEKDSD